MGDQIPDWRGPVQRRLDELLSARLGGIQDQRGEPAPAPDYYQQLLDLMRRYSPESRTPDAIRVGDYGAFKRMIDGLSGRPAPVQNTSPHAPPWNFVQLAGVPILVEDWIPPGYAAFVNQQGELVVLDFRRHLQQQSANCGQPWVAEIELCPRCGKSAAEHASVTRLDEEETPE